MDSLTIIALIGQELNIIFFVLCSLWDLFSAIFVKEKCSGGNPKKKLVFFVLK